MRVGLEKWLEAHKLIRIRSNSARSSSQDESFFRLVNLLSRAEPSQFTPSCELGPRGPIIVTNLYVFMLNSIHINHIRFMTTIICMCLRLPVAATMHNILIINKIMSEKGIGSIHRGGTHAQGTGSSIHIRHIVCKFDAVDQKLIQDDVRSAVPQTTTRKKTNRFP
jgi:hypothetical protein